MQSYDVKMPCVNSGWQRTCLRICCIALHNYCKYYTCVFCFFPLCHDENVTVEENVTHLCVESVLVRVTDWSCFAMVGWCRALEAIAECKALKMQGALVTYTKAINMLDKSSLAFAYSAYLFSKF